MTTCSLRGTSGCTTWAGEYCYHKCFVGKVPQSTFLGIVLLLSPQYGQLPKTNRVPHAFLRFLSAIGPPAKGVSMRSIAIIKNKRVLTSFLHSPLTRVLPKSLLHRATHWTPVRGGICFATSIQLYSACVETIPLSLSSCIQQRRREK